MELVVTTDWDILQSLHTAYRETVVDQATLGLWRRDHVQSARQTLVTGQRVLLGLVLAALAAGIVLAPRLTLTLVSASASLALLAAVLFRIVVCAVGMHRRDRGQADVAALDARDLPAYTVLVPVRQEADAVADLIDDLGALDYPAREARDPPADGGERHRDHRGGPGGTATVDDHVPDRAAGASADQGQGVQRGPVLRAR